MKKLMFFAVLSIMMGMTQVAMAQNANPTKVERSGNTFKSNKQTRQKSEPVATPYFYEENGVKHTIYMGSTGSCFIIKTSKKGNNYRKYLGAEISATICKEMGVEYKPKNK